MKRKTHIKFFSFLLVAILAFGTTFVNISPTVANAATVGKMTVDGITWSYMLLPDGTVASCPVNPTTLPETLDMPDTINGYKVTSIHGMGNSSAKYVQLGKYVNTIEPSAFAGNTNLVTIELSDNLKYIQTNAFSGCTNLESIVIPASVTTIEAGAFNNCTNMQSITFVSHTCTIADDSTTLSGNAITVISSTCATCYTYYTKYHDTNGLLWQHETASADTTDYQEVTKDSTYDVQVTFTQSPTYSVKIPKTITMNGLSTCTYNIAVMGDIPSDKKLVVVPTSSSFYLTDQSSATVKKDDIECTITPGKTSWTFSDLSTTSYTLDKTSRLTLNKQTAGTFMGVFQISISLQDL